MPNRSSKTGSDLFIVDNSDEDWKVHRYLHDWCQLSKAIDVATGYFEIGALLSLKDEWQKVDRIRILMGDEVTLRTRGAFAAGLATVREKLNATFTWTSTGGNKSSIGYFVTRCGDAPTITLHYRWRNIEDVRIPVELQTTPTRFGGPRWWFTCPLCVRGVACNRRAAKLYLPPGARYFGCRKCHDLTYRSSQEAHQAERGFARL